MKAKKILTNMLCASMVVSNITPVFATVTNDTLSFENTDTSASEETEVLYEKAGSYFVTIPKTISLGADKQSPYSVKVEGDIPSDKQVYVSPIDGIKDTEEFDFYMHDTNTANPKDDVVATVIQNKFYWNFSEVANGYSETNNKVTALDLTSGTWKGTFDFEINMHTLDLGDDFILTTDGDITIPIGESQQLNAYIDGIESNSDVIWSCDNEEVVIDNGLITLPSTLKAGSQIRITASKNGKAISFIATIGEAVKQQLAPGLYDENDVLLCSWEDSGLKSNCSDATDVVYRYSAKKVVLSPSVTSIGYNSFGGCYDLTTVIIPDSVTYINSYAFSNCRSLKDLVIPDSVQGIGSNAFKDVPHITYTGTATGAPWGAKSIN